jgi:hypothetical protein
MKINKKEVPMFRGIKLALLGGFVLSLVGIGFFLPAFSLAEGDAPAVRQADPSGGSTGTAIDVSAATAGEPTLLEVANTVGHNKVAINMV